VGLPLPSSSTPFQVLIVEDNPADAQLLEIMFKNCGINCELHFAIDGIEASDFLFKKGNFISATTPDLISLDLNLPKKNGNELLRDIRADKELCKVPVMILTTSSDPGAINELYSEGATVFVSKPNDIDIFQMTINALTSLYFKYAKLATR